MSAEIKFTKKELYEVAKWQKIILGFILFNLTFILGLSYLNSLEVSENILNNLFYFSLFASFMQIYCIFMLAKSTKSRFPYIWPLLILLPVFSPILLMVPLFALVVLNFNVNKILRNNNVKIGFLGAKLSELKE